MSNELKGGGGTYDVGEPPSDCDLRRDRVHEIQTVDLARLVLICKMTVIEVLLDKKLGLGHVCIGRIHHENTCEHAVEGKRVLSLGHELAFSVLTHGHECCPILVSHWVGTANELTRSFKLASFCVRECPLE